MALPHQKKDMLEAFRHAGAAEGQGSGPGGTGGPFAVEQEAVSPAPPSPVVEEAAAEKPAAEEPASGRRGRPRAEGEPVRALPWWGPWAGGILAAFVLGLALGRSLAPGETAAREPEGDTGSARETLPAGVEPREPARELAAPETGESLRGDDPTQGALFDAANRYTVVVATYGKTKTDFAWATHDQLRDAGIPVLPPLERKDDILVLVGAAPNASDLASTEKRVRETEGWDGDDKAFAGAYVERIDRLIQR